MTKGLFRPATQEQIRNRDYQEPRMLKREDFPDICSYMAYERQRLVELWSPLLYEIDRQSRERRLKEGCTPGVFISE